MVMTNGIITTGSVQFGSYKAEWMGFSSQNNIQIFEVYSEMLRNNQEISLLWVRPKNCSQ